MEKPLCVVITAGFVDHFALGCHQDGDICQLKVVGDVAHPKPRHGILSVSPIYLS